MRKTVIICDVCECEISEEEVTTPQIELTYNIDGQTKGTSVYKDLCGKCSKIIEDAIIAYKK